MKINSEVRYAAHPQDVKHYDTAQLRKNYLIDKVFSADEINIVYTMHDRMIAGGAMPVKEVLELKPIDILRAEYFLSRREIGIFNVGGKSLGFVREVVYIRGLNWVIVGNALTNHYRVFRGSHLVFSMAPLEETGGAFLELKVSSERDEPLAILVACVLNHWAKRPDASPAKRRFRLPSLANPNLSYGISCPPSSAKKD